MPEPLHTQIQLQLPLQLSLPLRTIYCSCCDNKCCRQHAHTSCWTRQWFTARCFCYAVTAMLSPSPPLFPTPSPPTPPNQRHHNANICATCCSIFVATTNHAAFGIKYTPHLLLLLPPLLPCVILIWLCDMRAVCLAGRVYVFFLL